MTAFTTIPLYQQQLLNQETTCTATVQHYLNNISQKASLNAFVAVYEAEALAKAAALDADRLSGKPIKKLHGVVIAIKDVICYASHTVTAASAILKGFESIYTATALQFLLDEDAIIIGNCNCDEFAMGSTNENSVYGKVLNDADPQKVPGGSSGGSAVAVQADLCMLSLGSDTGGSVRQPASFCGIIGVKPGYGQISRYGLLAYASSFDQIGVLGKDIDDVALVLDIMCRADEKDSTMASSITDCYPLPADDTKKYKCCYFPEAINHPSLDPEIKQAMRQQVVSLQLQGHFVEPVTFDLMDFIVPAYYVLTTAEASSNLARYDGVRYGHQSKQPAANLSEFYLNNRTEGFGLEVKRRIMLGTFVLSTGYYDAYFSKAQKIRAMLVEKINDIFSYYDAIVMPSSPSTAFDVGQGDRDPIAMYLADIYTVLANLTGSAAISIPLFSHSNNMPFGLQLIANKGEELTLLSIAKMLMQPQTAAKGVAVQ